MGSGIKGFKIIIVLLLFYYLIHYFFNVSGIARWSSNVLFDIWVYIGISSFYIWKYRRKNLLCFELMVLPIAFLGLFFDDLIYPFAPELVKLFSISNDFIIVKSEDIQMMAILVFLFGASLANERYMYGSTPKARWVNHDAGVDYKLLVAIITGFILVLIIYDYMTGVFNTWFYYSNADWMDREDRNQGLGHLTCLLLAASTAELVRLRKLGVSGFAQFIKCINKVFLIEWLGISYLLFASGNRNEMLLTLLPLVVGYSICIKVIPNKLLIVFGLIGILLMAIVGMTRQEEVSIQGSDLGILSFTRDFADLGYNSDYLVEYTDLHGVSGFGGIPGYLLSGVPFVGNVILNALDYKAPTSSSRITTESVMSNSGLGTSLIGDLYYTAGFVWVIIYMCLLGYLMAKLYYSDRNLNIYWLTFYSFMVANAVYYVRSSWLFPMTEIEYAIIILLIGSLFCKNQKKTMLRNS